MALEEGKGGLFVLKAWITVNIIQTLHHFVYVTPHFIYGIQRVNAQTVKQFNVGRNVYCVLVLTTSKRL